MKDPILSALTQEPYQVLLKFPELPFLTRITYSKKIGGRVEEIEELSLDEAQVIHFCKFKGKKKEGNGCEFLKDLRTLGNEIKPTDWCLNKGIYVDEHYKQY